MRAMFGVPGNGAPHNWRLQMPKFTIELPDTHVVSSRDRNVSVDLSKISADILGRLALHGLTQKVADSAASALADAGFKGLAFADLDDESKEKVRDMAVAAMTGTIESLVAGEWSERSAGAPAVDPVTARVRNILGVWLRANDKAEWAKTYKPLDVAKRAEALDAFFAEQSDEVQAATVKQAKDELAAEAKAKQKIGGLGLTINVKK
jgi:hypothetical protein